MNSTGNVVPKEVPKLIERNTADAASLAGPARMLDRGQPWNIFNDQSSLNIWTFILSGPLIRIQAWGRSNVKSKRHMMAGGAVLAVLLTSCSGPKGTVVPTDPQKWDTIAVSVSKLSDEDKALFTGYATRMTIGSVLAGGRSEISPGTTIGDAIEAQRDFLAKQKQDEAQAELLKAKVAAERSAEIAKLNQAATVALASLKVLPKDFDAGRFSDRFDMLLAVQNRTGKEISGIKGALNFKDQFGADIATISLSLDEDIEPNATRSIGGYGKDINQFEESDNKLAVTPLSKMHVTFIPEMIVFSDGTKMLASDGTEE